jgi:hypothetical protein
VSRHVPPRRAGRRVRGPRPLGLGGAAALASLLAGLPASPARAEGPCPARWEAAAGPLPGGIGPADFGAIPEACAASDLALRLRGTLLVASSAPDFFGSVMAGAMLRYRHALSSRTWISLAADAVTFRYVANAVVTSSGLSAGPPTVALHRAVAAGADWQVAVYGRALLPFDSARREGFETGFELGSAVRFAARARLGLDGGLALVGPVDVVAGQVHASLSPTGLVEGWFAPRSHIALYAGVAARFEAAPSLSFTSLVPRGAARFALRHGAWLAVLVEVPVVGTDRTDLVAAFYAGWSPP